MKRRLCVTIASFAVAIALVRCNEVSGPSSPPTSSVEDVVSVVGGVLNAGAVDDGNESAKALRLIDDTGGPTITPPKLRSNSHGSFDVAIDGVVSEHPITDVPYTLADVHRLRIGVNGYGGYYAVDVAPENQLIEGEILVTVLQEDVELLNPELTLEIVAEDADGWQGAVVKVSAAFFAASAGTDGFARPGDTVPLLATFEGGSGTPTVIWSQVSGPDVTITDPFAASTGFVAAEEPGTYVMKLRAKDPTGVVDVDLVTIVVLDGFGVDAGESAVISVGDTVPLRAVTFGGTGQADFLWNEISTQGVTIDNAAGQFASFVVPEAGEYEFEVTATDAVEGAATDRVIYLAGAGLQALATAPAEANIGDTVQLQGVAAGGFYPYAFRWSQTSDLTVALEDATNQTATATLQNAGTYTFKLTIGDSTGSTATDSATVVVRCQTDANCNDGLFCNGTETCAGDLCVPGTPPCADAQVCDEDSGTCGECVVDSDCQEGQSCIGGICEPVCTNDADCDDGEFCNGQETCEISEGICSAGISPCADDEFCDEEAATCSPGCPGSDTICSCVWIADAIDTVVDTDQFVFTGNAGHCIYAQANRTSDSLNPVIDLFPPDGGDREAQARAGGGSIAQLYAHELAQSGEYTLLIRDDGANGTGGYLLSYLDLDGAITCSLDPNGGPIVLDEATEGSIDPVVDMDVYTFQGVAGQRVIIQANRTSGDLNPVIDLFPPSGCDREAQARAGGGSIAQLYDQTLAETGVYRILIRDDGANGTGEYLLSLNFLQ